MREGHGGKFDAVPDSYTVRFLFRGNEFTEKVKAISRKAAVRTALLRVIYREVRPANNAQARLAISSAYEVATQSARVRNNTQKELERRMAQQRPAQQIVMDL